MAKVRPNKIDFVANPQLSNESMVNLDEGLDNLDSKVNDYLEEVKDYIVEVGDNYEKWASGKMVQWGKYTIAPAIVTNYPLGSLFKTTDTYVFTFPIPFVDDNVSANANAGTFIATAISGTTRNSMNLQFLSGRNTDSVSLLNWRATGKWKL